MAVPEFTDYVLRVPGPAQVEVFKFIDEHVVPVVRQIGERAVESLSVFESNDDGESFYSVAEERDALRAGLQALAEDYPSMSGGMVKAWLTEQVAALLASTRRETHGG